MKHFTIQTDEQAGELKPFNNTPKFPLKMGHIITPSAGVVERAYWYNYPEADALTFEQCMDIVDDKVTDDVMKELGAIGYEIILHDGLRIGWNGKDVRIEIDNLAGDRWVNILNPTATKIRLLTQILGGQ